MSSLPPPLLGRVGRRKNAWVRLLHVWERKPLPGQVPARKATRPWRHGVWRRPDVHRRVEGRRAPGRGHVLQLGRVALRGRLPPRQEARCRLALPHRWRVHGAGMERREARARARKTDHGHGDIGENYETELGRTLVVWQRCRCCGRVVDCDGGNGDRGAVFNGIGSGRELAMTTGFSVCCAEGAGFSSLAQLVGGVAVHIWEEKATGGDG
ncbi:unnamed protein product [Phaeothamnion confervicola]